MPKPKVLILDDVPAFLREMGSVLRPAFVPSLCSSPLRAIRQLRRGDVDLLLTTLVMKEMDGFEVIRRVRSFQPDLPILMVTGFGNESTSVEALRLGATDYLDKPIEPEELLARIQKALCRQKQPITSGVQEMITRSHRLLETLRQARQVAPTSSRVLILGETGTGKELLAGQIHQRSKRRKGPFVTVNCAAIPSELMESEFFGHEPGAFTGAAQRRTGRFEQAGEGTLFLDEIGELTFSLQSKLLRVLQSGEFSRVGGERILQSHARILAATNRDLEQEVRAGRFRADLFFRLQVVTLSIPPLRERPEDLPDLLSLFLRRHAVSQNLQPRLSRPAFACLEAHPWPGNVRELEHLVERLCVLHPGETIDVHHLPAPLQQRPPAVSDLSSSTPTYREAREAFQSAYFRQLLDLSRGNLAQAARLAGMERGQLFRKVVQLNLHSPHVR